MTTLTHINNLGVQKIRAICSTVSNIERSHLFYTQALSFKLVFDLTIEAKEYSELQGLEPTQIRSVTLQLGNEVIKLQEYLDIMGKPIPVDSRSNDLWFQHLAIVVRDIDRAYDHLQSFDIEPISSGLQTLPNGIRAFKFKDPDGHDLEIIWFPPDQSKDKWQQNTEELFLGIDHSAITVADTEQSVRFYCNLLGMEVAESNINSGEIQAHLDDLSKAEVRVTSLRSQQGGLGIELLDYIVPGTGRSFPNDWQSYDLATMQLQLVINDIEAAVNTLKENEVEIISPKIVRFPNSYPYRQACLVKDPNGHAIMLITI
jgi:catechol 2,3-dioxygenase-like lactoylglutathione lyase family enzyme